MKGTQATAIALALSLGTFSTVASVEPGSLVEWGNITNVPVGLVNVAAIAAGSGHSLALKADGTVSAWGRGMIDERSWPNLGQSIPPPGLANVMAIAAGASHSLALKTDGTVIAWGRYYNGSSFVPVTVPSGLRNVVAIAAGEVDYISLALKADHTITAWGSNLYGLADVPSALTNVVAIASGGVHNLALKSDATVVAWGAGSFGETNVPPGLNNVVAIAAGGYHNLALRGDGTVVAWGSNFDGESNVPSGLRNVAAIAAGNYCSLALKNDGTVVAWGRSSAEKLNELAGLSGVVAIAARIGHGLSITLRPLIWQKPSAAMSLDNGDHTNLSASVWSRYPFTCQWFFNDLPIVDSVGTNLTVNAFDFTGAGSYSVKVSNQYGYATAVSVLRLRNSPVVLVNGADVGGGRVDQVKSAQVSMSSTFGTDAHIYYTLDGSQPGFTSIPYSGIFTLTNTTEIRTIAYNSGYTDWAEAAAIRLQIWPTYPLEANTPGGGSISVLPSPYVDNHYVSNTVVTLTATPSNGWSFLRWMGGSASTSDITTVLMDRPRSVQAVFGTSLNLFTNGNGHMLLNPAIGPYAFGSPVQLAAVPGGGSYFFGWAGAATGSANPLCITATNATGITALFGTLSANQVSLTVLPNGDGSVPVSPSRNVYANGETVTLTAVPAPNGVFTGWSSGASGNLNPLSLTLRASTVITANFGGSAPALRITQRDNNIVLSWPVVYSNYLVLRSAGLSGSAWITNTTPQTISDIDRIVTVPATNIQMFYRLKH